ncbi:MAG: hypothetical protein KDI46_02225 [Alphaproteobacteria bacterium]|nr:hypothetical protein [Alphaproteobacteria bacterium]
MMKRLLLIAPFLLLTACGFQPVYGVNKYEATGVENRLAQIEIGGIPDREGQYLRNALIDRFYREGRPQNPSLRLQLTPVTESKSNLDITINADATRGQLLLATTMTLSDIKTGKKLLTRNLQSIASYNILASEFTNRVSEQNARENLLDDLARQTEQQIALYLKRPQ